MSDIRGLRSEDRDAVYAICLATGDAGRDASSLYRDCELLGHVYAGPYAALEPESGFVVEDEQGVGGYIVGARDTYAFIQRMELEWWPGLRTRYPDPAKLPQPDRHMAGLIHKPDRMPRRITEPYPSHLHINLLPRLQGGGWGKRLIDRWLAEMRAQGSPGSHLAVGMRNARAVRFYGAYGFHEIAREDDVLVLGVKL